MSDLAFDSSCIFCRISAREAPGEILHESDSVVAFRDANPKAPVHILLIPKEHIVSLQDVGETHAGMLASLIQTAVHLANAEGIAESGWRMVANVGPHAGQSVFHLHFHLLGGRPMGWPPG
jgi:histidine triad (HIT) family protein